MKPKFFILIIVCLFILTEATFAQRRIPARRPLKRTMLQRMNHQEMLGFYFGQDLDNQNYLASAFLWIPAGIFWNFAPGVDYYFTDREAHLQQWQFNGDLIFKPRPLGVFYLGGGLAVDYILPEKGENITEFGGNALAGLQFGSLSPFKFFMQARWTFLRDTRFSVMGGIKLVLR